MAKGSAARAIGIGIGRRHVGDDLRRRRGGRRGRDRHGGGASRAGACGLRSGRGTTEVAFATSVCGVTVGTGAAAGGVIATEDEGLRSGRGSASAGVAAGFRSGVGTVPVSIVASDAIEGEGSGAGECLARGLCGCRVLCGGERVRRPARPASLALTDCGPAERAETCAFAARAGFAAARTRRLRHGDRRSDTREASK